MTNEQIIEELARAREQYDTDAADKTVTAYRRSEAYLNALDRCATAARENLQAA